MRMKNILLLLMLFCLSSSPLAAQGNFAPVGATWTYTSYYHLPPPFSWGPYVITVESIEMLQSKLCSKINLGTDGFSGFPDPCFVYESNDSVFFWSYISEQFQLLYDFGAEVGESWVIGGLQVGDTSKYDDFLTVTVDSIKTLVLNQDTLKVWHIHRSAFEWDNVIIEGIGNTRFLLPSDGIFESTFNTLRCYGDEEDEYFFVSYPCDTIIRNTTSTKDVSSVEHNIVINPNPVTIYLQISADDFINDGFIRIFNMQGYQVLKERLRNTGMYDVSRLSPGIYQCEVWSGLHRLHVERIVKLP